MKAAVITGASSGMGREFAVRLSAMHPELDEIWVIARNRASLEELKNKISCKVRVIPADITGRKDLDALHGLLEKYRPDVRYLVNGAGYGIQKKVRETSMDDCGEMIEVNCRALTEVTRMVLPFCKENSHIIMLASASAFIPQPEFAVYAASKAYVLSFSRALAREERGRIAVTIVCPGPVDTPFLTKMGGKNHMPAYKKRFIARPECVVFRAIRDADRNREFSIYGFSMKFFFILCKILPHGVILKAVEIFGR